MPLKRQRKRSPYAQLFVICTEGRNTEPQYFGLPFFKSWERQVMSFSSPNGSSPGNVKEAMNKWINRNTLQPGDELWLVVDVDQWTDDQLTDLFAWAKEAKAGVARGVVVTNPKFEYWLLLHFEDNPPATCRACCEHLNIYLPNYDKSIPVGAFNVENVRRAIERAREGDIPPAVAYPREPGRTTVYRLAERLLS